MGILANENAIGGGNYLIERSLRFQSASSQSLSRTPASASNRKTYTWSGWVKRGAFSDGWLFAAGTSGTEYSGILLNATSNNILQFNAVTASTNRIVCTTAAVLRDPSAWYHLVIAVDTTQATNSNGVKMYINGTQQTLTFTAYTQNVDTAINNNVVQNIGSVLSTQYFDGYMAEVNFIDGQALTPSSFGETDALTGVWVAKRYTGTYGTNGFYLKFNDGTSTTTLGQDRSGNANNWTLTNFTRSAGVSDCWMYDVPSGNGSPSATQPSSNYATLNPIGYALTNTTISRGNLQAQLGTGSQWRTVFSTQAVSSGKWYVEGTVVNTGAGGDCLIGIIRSDSVVSGNWYIGNTATGYGYAGNAVKYNNNTFPAYGATYTTNDVIGVAFDADSGTLTFYKNGVSQGTAYTGILGEYYFAIGGGNTIPTWAFNAGQRSFAYTPPSGFKALCTANLPAPTIAKGNQYMDATLYTGDGTTNRAVVNAAGFAPDFVWVKSRSSAASHLLVDSVRGASAVVYSNSTIAEQTINPIASLNSNGFSVNQPNTGSDSSNINAVTYVGWQWKAGSSTVTNTSGSISSQVRANTTAGFSIVTYTGNGTSGATIGHGLGVAPKMIIVKNRTNTVSGNGNWPVYHVSTGNTNYTSLNLTNASAAASGFWNNTSPTSTVFTVGNTGTVNDSGFNYVAYCFAEIAGFSRFGSYTGNGSADGVFVYTGFRPKYLLIKNTTTAGYAWIAIDSIRSPNNVANNLLEANTSVAEYANDPNVIFDFLSNGFKARSTSFASNGSSNTYIYMAFSENPFNYSNAR